MSETIQQLKDKIEEYEKILGIGDYDIEKSAFFSLCRIADMQTNRLNKFNLENEISQNAKEDKVYDRTKAIWEGLPKMIIDINNLRKELNIGKKEVNQQMNRNISPESIASTIGDYKQQDV